MSEPIKGGSPEELAPVKVECDMDEFENAIRKVGAINACEWFGYTASDDFTRRTIAVLAHRSAEAKQ